MASSTPARPPVVAAVAVVAAVTVIYLAIGVMVILAYASAKDATGQIHMLWERVPGTAPGLLPGVTLGTTAVFLRRHKWAVALASVLIAIGLPVPLRWAVFYAAYFQYVPVKAALVLALSAAWIALFGAGLWLLRRQWSWLRSAALAPGSAFEVLRR